MSQRNLILFIIVGLLIFSSILFFTLEKKDKEMVLEEEWDASCGEVGVKAYQSDTFEYEIPEIPLEWGDIITVTNDSDIVNGSVSSLDSLLDNPGSDGISFREAMKVTSLSPGKYTIKFAEHLKGAEIEIGSWNGSFLPELNGGNVIVNGDITNDGGPDITIKSFQEGGDYESVAFTISSSRNVIYGLKIKDFDSGIVFFPKGKGRVFTDNIISNVTIKSDKGKIITVHQGINFTETEVDEIVETNNKWLNTTIVNNNMEAAGGIKFHIEGFSGDEIKNTKIINNRIVVGGVRFVSGIQLIAGSWGSSNDNKIIDTVIADNDIKIIGFGDTAGIRIASGDNGSSGNLVDGVVISNNKIEAILGEDDTPAMQGIFFSSGDSSTRHDKPDYRPIVYPENNMLKNVEIISNEIKGFINHGIYVMAGLNGAKHNYVKDFSILGNMININPSYAEHAGRPGGIGLYSGPINRDWEDPIGRASTDNLLSDTVIKWNTVELAEPHNLYMSELYYIPDKPKGIIVHEYEEKDNKIENIDLLYNLLTEEGILVNTEKINRECNKVEIK